VDLLLRFGRQYMLRYWWWYLAGAIRGCIGLRSTLITAVD